MTKTRYGYAVLSEATLALATVLGNATDAELRAAARALRKLDTTNCWWAVYSARAVLCDIVAMERKFRRDRKRQEHKIPPRDAAKGEG